MREELATIPDALEVPAGRSRLLSRLYRDIGMAAVAEELGLPSAEFEPEVAAAIERGREHLIPQPMALAS